MRNRTRRFSSTIGIVLSFVVVLVLIVLVQFLPNRISTQQAPKPVAQLIEATKPDSPLPTPFTPVVIIEPTWTVPPTSTPWPSPTLHPEATSTPLSPFPIPDNPSGHLFYFSRSKFQAGVAGFDEQGDIYETQIDALGNNDRIHSVENKGLYRLYPSWDKSRIALVNTTMSGDKVTVYDPLSSQSNLKANMGDFFGFFAGWHPNGKELLFRVDRNVYAGLWLINIEAGTRTIVVQEDTLYITDAAISPNGQQIIYRRQKGWQAQPELWLVFTDGSKPQQINSDAIISGLSWSPDGKSIAYFGASGLCVISTENPQCRLLSSNAKSLDFFTPIWSPNSKYVAYVGYSASDASSDNQANADPSKDWNKYVFSGAEVFVVDTASGEQKALLDSKFPTGGYIDPTWSPDGSMLAFAGYDGEKGMIITVNLNDLKSHIVATHEDIVRFPAWTK